MVSFLFSEMWFGSAVSMLQNIFPAQLIGSAMAVFLFSGSIAGALSNLFLGLLNDKYQADENPTAAGNLLTIVVGVSYIGSAPFFILSGILYQRYVKEKGVNHLSQSKISQE